MSTVFPYLEVPDRVLPIVGEPDEGTRVYRREGSMEESAEWFDVVNSLSSEGFVSPGGVTMFANVSRAAVYKRMRDGKLTCFLFHVTTRRKTLFGKVRALRSSPYGYIPVSECKAWQRELEERYDVKTEPIAEKTRRANEDYVRGTKDVWEKRDKKKR